MPSPAARFAAFCREGKLAYQWDPVGKRPVWPPRVVAPGSGATELEWRESAGIGSVYATTVARPRGAPPRNIVLVDLDEGYRMMSRVEGVAPEDVRIGMRVRVRFDAELPVFVAA